MTEAEKAKILLTHGTLIRSVKSKKEVRWHYSKVIYSYKKIIEEIEEKLKKGGLPEEIEEKIYELYVKTVQESEEFWEMIYKIEELVPEYGGR